MAKGTITISSVGGGESTFDGFAAKNQYAYSTNISIEEGDLKPLSATSYDSPSGTPLWLIDNPKDTNVYRYGSDGKIYAVPADQSAITALNSGTALTSSAGNGAEYYDNYIYFAKNTDISRYGPLNGSPSLTQSYWVGTLSKTALTDTTYPSIGSLEIPNHPMYRHTDNKLYIGDVVGGKGVIHFIKTSKTSAEGDTNDGSTYEALDLPYGYYPTCIAGYGSDLVIGAIDGTGLGRPAKLIFWDTTSVSYTQILDKELSDPLITALRNVNGTLYVVSGSTDKGLGGAYTRVNVFAGGYTMRPVEFLKDYKPTFSGATAHSGSKFYYGIETEVRGIGSATGLLSQYASTTIYEMGASVSAICTYETPSQSEANFLIGTTTPGFFYTGTGSAVGRTFLSQRYKIGHPFQITKVTFPTNGISNGTITPTVNLDDSSSSASLAVFNSTNYAASEKRYVDYPIINGLNDFKLVLTWPTTSTTTVYLPIVIEIDTIEDAPQ